MERVECTEVNIVGTVYIGAEGNGPDLMFPLR